MILSRARRYIFIHIPKTGGTALTLALEARAARGDVILADTPKGRARRRRITGVEAAGRLWKHSSLAEIRGLATDQEIATFFTFTLVRNPWDRMVSYYHWLRAQSFAHPAVALARATDFAGFLAAPQTQAALAANPYSRYVTTAAGEERCDLFLRLEHLHEEAGALEARLGFRLPPLPLANASARPRDWRPFYGAREAGTVARLCAADIARFGYRFDPL
ncbi:sulfotransferase family 2 domain-containing protein [Albidovulum sp.]|uniref:sulfotransferase family 2 domain-containing protein n=1 Tax=Albidovulum sp. TaxID=1872424 RepID=UPI0039B857B0